jgi:beta-xylosidase
MRQLLIVMLCTTLGLTAGTQPAPAQKSEIQKDGSTLLLFSFFRNNGEDGLYLASSKDGLQWNELKPPGKTFLQPKLADKLMRDPCLAQGPDGMFHMVWTCGWGKPAVIGIAHSKDLINWSEQQALPVMAHEPESKNAWAPEIFCDEAKSQWLIFWSTTIPGRFPETENAGDNNHRIYFTATKDFTNYTPTTLFYNGGFNVIDATLLPAKGKYYLVVKNETKNPVKKTIHLSMSDNAAGPFGPAGPAIGTNWVEGPTAIQMGREYYVYFDHYTRPQYYGVTKSTDLEHWEDLSRQLHFPAGARHGTVLRVPEKIVQNIQSLESNKPGQP